ncbi:MAG TPA: type II and III secretion system protein family protein [Ramlibacter sp.]|nr:type II and III secretion system protein family protein [Ramlibacter sp.]
MRATPIATASLAALAMSFATLATAQTTAPPAASTDPNAQAPAAAPGTATQPAAQPRRAGAATPGAGGARAGSAARPAAPVAGANANRALMPCTSVTVDPPLSLALGKSQVVRLEYPVTRMVVGGQPTSRAGVPATVTTDKPAPGAAAGVAGGAQGSDGVADTEITLLSPTELFFLGRRTGSMNVVLQGSDGRCVVKDIVVTVDPTTLQAKLKELLPDESGVTVRGAENAVVLSGNVSDSIKLDQVLTLAGAYGDGKKVVNMLRITTPQQVMLEVKIAEVSKTLLDRFGLDFSRMFRNGDKFSVFTGILGGKPGGAGTIRPRPNIQGEFNVPDTYPLASLINSANSASQFGLNAERQDGIFRVLAEPNIMAISGQAASFLSGGKIFIPVAQTREGSGVTITLEEKEFGVGLKFTPTVLDGRINLKVQSEVSELSQTGTPFTTVGGVTAVLPSMSTRRVDTTVQLGDGQSYVVAGLIKNNYTEALNRFPGLGETPVMGALFRSTEFQNDQTELMFVVTPRVVRPFVGPVALPTDNHVVPTRNEVMLNGAAEGARPAPVTPQPSVQAQPLPAGTIAPAPRP